MSSLDQWRTTKCSSLGHQSSGACTRRGRYHVFPAIELPQIWKRRREGAFVFRRSSYLALRGAFAERLPMDTGEKDYTGGSIGLKFYLHYERA